MEQEEIKTKINNFNKSMEMLEKSNNHQTVKIREKDSTAYTQYRYLTEIFKISYSRFDLFKLKIRYSKLNDKYSESFIVSLSGCNVKFQNSFNEGNNGIVEEINFLHREFLSLIAKLINKIGLYNNIEESKIMMDCLAVISICHTVLYNEALEKF